MRSKGCGYTQTRVMNGCPLYQCVMPQGVQSWVRVVVSLYQIVMGEVLQSDKGQQATKSVRGGSGWAANDADDRAWYFYIRARTPKKNARPVYS